MTNKRNLTERQIHRLFERKAKKMQKRLSKHNILYNFDNIDIEEINKQIEAEIETDKFVKNFVAQYVN